MHVISITGSLKKVIQKDVQKGKYKTEAEGQATYDKVIYITKIIFSFYIFDELYSNHSFNHY